MQKHCYEPFGIERIQVGDIWSLLSGVSNDHIVLKIFFHDTKGMIKHYWVAKSSDETVNKIIRFFLWMTSNLGIWIEKPFSNFFKFRLA